MKYIVYLLIIISTFSCSGSDDDNGVLCCSVPVEENPFEICNSSLPTCDFEGEYCLFGFKWGEGNDFANTGLDAEGPKISGGTISFSFQELPNMVSNHRQLDFPTVSFDELPGCAKELIRESFEDYSRVADIQFEELAEDSEADIRIFVAPVSTCGNGFPNYSSQPCQELAGNIILSPNFTTDCNVFHSYFLHELGHTLGLGHSSTDNIMGSINTNLDGLKEGDIKGIQQIYGE